VWGKWSLAAAQGVTEFPVSLSFTWGRSGPPVIEARTSSERITSF
jgi:hypothetical protein